MSAHFLRYVGRQHGLHSGVEKRVGKVAELHGVERAFLDVERGRGLGVTDKLHAGELYLVRNGGESRGVGELHLVEEETKGIRQPRDLASVGEEIEVGKVEG